ncbi:MAG: hypothetical protein Q8L47_04985 [bacterium]|nr:hypothetical protein [bacterium]
MLNNKGFASFVLIAFVALVFAIGGSFGLYYFKNLNKKNELISIVSPSLSPTINPNSFSTTLNTPKPSTTMSHYYKTQENTDLEVNLEFSAEDISMTLYDGLGREAGDISDEAMAQNKLIPNSQRLFSPYSKTLMNTYSITGTVIPTNLIIKVNKSTKFVLRLTQYLTHPIYRLEYTYSQKEVPAGGLISMKLGELTSESMLNIDNNGDGIVDEKIRPINPPIANISFIAGPLHFGALITLDGTNSKDPLDRKLTYSWRQLQGPKVDLLNPNKVKTTFIVPKVTSDEMISFELIVDNGFEKSEKSIQSITIQP